MRLYLKNIGMIKEADVKLDGLTVIAGENDTGKSTIGKVVFSLVKGIQKYEESLESKYRKEIIRYLDNFYARYHIKIEKSKNGFLFFPPIFTDNILKIRKNNKENFDKFIKNYIKLVNQIDNSEMLKDFKLLIAKIKETFKDNDLKILQEEALRRAFFSEFRNQLVSKKEGIIKIYEGKEKKIEIEINKNGIKLENSLDINLDDVTLIETPIILNFSDMIQRAKSHFEEEELNKTLIRLESDVVYHSKDLINKLTNAAKYGEYKIEEKLLSYLKFDFKYNDVTSEFVYVKNNKEFSSINVADGIKSFGIIKLLLKGSYIKENTLLIIDEPEVHLHPKWQIEYAKLIIELVKKDIKVLITSHSPFFIDAIDKLSYDIKRNYYFAENGIIKKDNDLKLMYEKLNVAIDELENLEIEEMFFKAKN
ncbi:AAA family ATPase [Caminibacter sp.]